MNKIDLNKIFSLSEYKSRERKVIEDPALLISNKLSIICSKDIQGICNDLYDIYLIATYEGFNINELFTEISKNLKSKTIKLGKFSLLNPDILYKLKHEYRIIKLMDMPTFDEMCKVTFNFLLPIIAKFDGTEVNDITWNPKDSMWNTSRIYGTRISTDLKGIICKETASGLLHLSTFPPFPVLVKNDKISINMGVVRFFKESCNEKFILDLSDTLKITNKELTIVDMLEDGEYRILAESIVSYIDENKDLSKLYDTAKEFGKYDLLLETIDYVFEYQDK